MQPEARVLDGRASWPQLLRSAQFFLRRRQLVAIGEDLDEAAAIAWGERIEFDRPPRILHGIAVPPDAPEQHATDDSQIRVVRVQLHSFIEQSQSLVEGFDR